MAMRWHWRVRIASCLASGAAMWPTSMRSRVASHRQKHCAGCVAADGFNGPLLLDAGTANLAAWTMVAQPGMEAVVGLETLHSFAALADLSAVVPVIFSLDLRDGKPLLTGSLTAETGSEDVGVIARAAIQAGVRGVLLLDVARVGRGQRCRPPPHRITAAEPA